MTDLSTSGGHSESHAENPKGDGGHAGGHKAQAPSQFLAGTNIQFAVDSTSLGDFKRCAKYYEYTHIEGWVPAEDNIHLRFGIEYHQALHDYELAKASGEKYEEALRTTIRQLLTRIHSWEPDREIRAGQYKNPETLVRTVIWYLDLFKNDPAETVILADGKPALEVSFKWPLDYGPKTANGTQPYLLCGHLDRLVKYPKNTENQFVMDRKTSTSQLTSYYFSQFEPSNQMSLYAMSSQIVIHSPVKGVIIDAAQVLIEESRFQRHVSYRTPAQLDEWMSDLGRWLAYMELCALENYWPQNDTACTMYGGCRFRKVCSRSPQVRERFLEADFIKLPREDRWNPLRVR